MRTRSIAVVILLAASGNCSMTVCISPRSEYVPSMSASITLAITIIVPTTRGILIASRHTTAAQRFDVGKKRGLGHDVISNSVIDADQESASLRRITGAPSRTGPE